MMLMRWTLLALSILSLLACQVPTVSVQEVVDETVPASAGGRLVITNVNGNVEVTSWDRDEIHVEATKTASAFSPGRAEEALKEVSIEITRDDDAVKIGVDRPRRSNWLRNGGVSTGVHFRISAPADADVRLETVNGRLEVTATRGPVEARSVNGRITLRDVRGPVEASAVNGAIRADLAAFDDGSELKLTTTNGSIAVTLPADARADLDARTTNGRIQSAHPVDGDRGRRRLRGRINGGGGQLSLRTTNGSIRLSAS